jgi:imidazolonepropionase-like amidohydrolase
MTMNQLATELRTTAEALQGVAALSNERPVWVRVGRLFDGDSESLVRDADLVFDAEQIRFVGFGGRTPPADLVADGQMAPDATLPEWTVLPCLIEAHAHMFLDGAPIDAGERESYLKQPAEWMLARANARWPRLIEFGIGAIRDAGDKYGVGLALAAQAKSARSDRLTAELQQCAPRPWIDSPGAAIHHRGRYGSFMAEPIEKFATAAECVASRVAQGVDRIKLLATGIIDFKAGRVTVPPQMTADEVQALVEAAFRHGRPTFAHASGSDGIQNCIDGGVDTIEHGFFVTEQQLAQMRDRQIAWVPTLAPIQAQIDRANELGHPSRVVDGLRAIIDGHRRMIMRAHQIGVRLLAGSDAGSCGVPHGASFLEELCQMEVAGLSPLAVLRAATGASAAALNFAEPVGLIRAGHRARLIFTAQDIEAGVSSLRQGKAVFFDGSLAEPAAGAASLTRMCPNTSEHATYEGL